MGESTLQLIRLLCFTLSFTLVFALQSLAPYRRAARLVGGNWRQNLPMSALNTILVSLVCGACLCSGARYAEARGLGMFRIMGAPSLLAVAGTVVILDLALWGWHLANHRLSWLWSFHRVHHSDVDFDVSTSLRFHAGELLLSLPFKLVTIIALGAPLGGILAFEITFGLFNMFVHGNIRIAPSWESRMSSILVLPAVHRLHHSIRPEQHGRNFGTIFSLWDRLLGTWAGGSSADFIRTGLPDLMDSGGLSLWRCLMLPFGVTRKSRAL